MSRYNLEVKYFNEFGDCFHMSESFNKDAVLTIGSTKFDHVVESFKRFLRYAKSSDELVDSIHIVAQNGTFK